MLTVPAGVRVFLALGATDMRKGYDGLAVLVQDVLMQSPFSGHLFVFRGRRGDRIKLLYYDQNGMCLFAKRLDQGRFTWPTTKEAPRGSIMLTPAQLAMLLEGLEWRTPTRTWVPTLAG